MKKMKILVVVAFAAMTISGCKKEAARAHKVPADNKQILEVTTKNNGISTEANEYDYQEKTERIDETESKYRNDTKSGDGEVVDLTQMSATLVYAEVYNMMMAPEDYIGKTIKMEGTYTPYHDDATGKDYFACIVSDATACCSQGIEFELTSDYKYPDDYPKDGDIICVTGVFDTYKEGKDEYSVLRGATLE